MPEGRKEEGWEITPNPEHARTSRLTGGNQAVPGKPGRRFSRTRMPRTRSPAWPELECGRCRQGGQDGRARGAGTPGHTMCHVFLRSHTRPAALFCGDTCSMPAPELPQRRPSGRAVQTLTSSSQAAAIDLDLSGPRLRGKQSAVHVESRARQRSARKMLDKLAGQDPTTRTYRRSRSKARSTRFFRLTSPMVIAKLRESFPDLPEKPDQRTVFS